MISSANVTVTTAPTLLTVDTDTDGRAGRSIAIRNTGVASIYLGGPSVTTSIGWELPAEEEISFDLGRLDVLYGVCASGTVAVKILQVGV